MRAVLDLLVPQDCVGCGTPGRLWCLDCAATLGGLPRRARAPGAPELAVWARAGYEGPGRRALIAYKERGARALARPLASALAGPLAMVGAAGTPIVPVPASRSGRNRRGFAHVGLLAATAAAEQRELGEVVDLLRWVRPVYDQAALSRQQRAANLAGALVCRSERLPPTTCGGVVLVDDVVTSGATLGEAARACRDAGVPVRAAVALLATRLA